MKYQVILFPYGDQIHTQHKYHAILLRRQRYLTKVEILFNLRRQMDSLQRKQAMDFKWYLIIVQEYFLTIDESFSYDSKKIMAKDHTFCRCFSIHNRYIGG